MARGRRDLSGYRFKGIPAQGSGATLQGAISDLVEFWNYRPTLVSHNWGVLTLQISIGTKTFQMEIADADLLDSLSVGDLEPFYAMVARVTGLSEDQVQQVLSETTDVVATVDRIRPPQGSGMVWQEDPGLGADQVLPGAMLDWSAEVGAEADMASRRSTSRPRSKVARDMMQILIRQAVDQGISDAELAKRTKIPVSTLRDARKRTRRSTAPGLFENRAPRSKLTEAQKDALLAALDQGESAEAVSARTGVAARTVRDLRLRAQRAAPAPKPSSKPAKASTSSKAAPSAAPPPVRSRRYTEAEKAKVLQKVAKASNQTPSEVARSLGIPERTVRSWVRQAKKKSVT